MLVAQGWRDGEMEISVKISSQETAMKIAKLGLPGDYSNGAVVLYVTPAEMQKVAMITDDITILKKYMNAWAESMKGSREAYHSYAEIIALADSLVEHFPEICQKTVYGMSIQNRQLAALKISDNVAVDETEAEVMFDGGIHGDEIGAAENVIRFARDLCLGYGVDDEITNLIDNREIWLYLMVNPDGRENMSRYNAAGVDINRDWPFMWNGEGSSSGPASQPETKALRNCAYNNQFVIHTTYHSGTEYISCPWSYRSSQPADLPGILHLAGVYADESGYANIDYGQGNTGMYPINGSSKDFNYGALGSVSWSMEISYDKQPPASQLMSFYLKNRPSMLAMIEYSGYGIEGMITDETTGEPIQAAIFIEDYYPCFNDPQVGDYHKYLLPGTYSLVVKANGYDDAFVDNIVINDLESTEVNVTMSPAENHKYIAKYPASQIPDNNNYDEGLVPAIIGAPDNVNYSVGKSGWIVFDMQDEIYNMEGDEITIYEGDETPEGYSLFAGASIDGPWVSLGEGEGTTSFDLSAGNVVKARFFKLIDDGDGNANTNDAGFDFDAAENIAMESDVYLLVDGFTISDENGNNNGVPEPGETLLLNVNVRNNGILTAYDVQGLLECYNPEVTITEPSVLFGDIDAGATGGQTFEVVLSEQILNGTPVMMTLSLESDGGMYASVVNISFTAGEITEDFETGDFSLLPWTFEGNSSWNITTPGAGSDYCAESGTITDNQTTSMVITANVLADGNISFDMKVSSESGYDYLQFYIDNALTDQWSGNSNWTGMTYNVSAGVHTFKWTYMKDGYVSSGADKGWIDNITFPSVSFDESGSITGIVTDAESGDLIEDVAITALHQSMYYFTTAETDESGVYGMMDIPAGDYEVCFEKEGYVTFCDIVTVTAGETLEFDVALQYGVGIEDFETVSAISAVPNPVNNGTVTLNLGQNINSEALMTVTDANGKQVLSRSVINPGTTIVLESSFIEGLPQGIYLLNIVAIKRLYISKIIKM
jgi:hypothetical protein